MRGLLFVGAALGVIAYAWFGSGDPNVYSMSQAEAYQKLRAAKVEKGNVAVFGKLDTSVSGNGDSKVYWNAGGNHCEAEITPEGSKSRIMAFCGGGSASDGAAAGMVAGMHRRALIEHIDAALTGRAFDPRKAVGETAARWPVDARQPDGSLGTAMGDAMKMQRDMAKATKDIDMDKMRYDSVTQPTSADATRPTVDLSR